MNSTYNYVKLLLEGKNIERQKENEILQKARTC